MTQDREILIETKALTKRYRNMKKTAVDAAAFVAYRGETVGLFGDSGSGKSTMGMMLAGLTAPSSGEILYEGTSVKMPYRGALRGKIQVLFQHPEVSFNPALPLLSSMKEPYQVCKLPFSEEILLGHIRQFGLNAEHMQRVPQELSGGELQRAALARILVMKPELIILDEPTSMLDVISQAQIMEMLADYQKEHGTTYVFISHARILCERVCDRIYRVEEGVFRLQEDSKGASAA